MVNALEDKKGEDITLIEILEISSFADYFVICSGTSERMLDALADEAEQNAKKNFGLNGRIEGTSQSGWMVVDLGDIVVHIFSQEQRDYYRLEELWSQGKVLVRLH